MQWPLLKKKLSWWAPDLVVLAKWPILVLIMIRTIHPLSQHASNSELRSLEIASNLPLEELSEVPESQQVSNSLSNPLDHVA